MPIRFRFGGEAPKADIVQISVASHPSGDNTVVGDQVQILHAINDPSVDLVIAERRLSTPLATWLDGVEPERLPRGRVLAHLRDIDRAVSAMADIAQTPDGAAARELVTDVVRLAHLFGDIAKVAFVDIRMDTVFHDSCWKFHRDFVKLRLFTTYIGPATQIVPRSWSERALEQQRAFDGPVYELPRQSIALFKGCKASRQSGVVHRSPPIMGSGAYRFILCVNQRSTASPELWEP